MIYKEDIAKYSIRLFIEKCDCYRYILLQFHAFSFFLFYLQARKYYCLSGLMEKQNLSGEYFRALVFLYSPEEALNDYLLCSYSPFSACILFMYMCISSNHACKQAKHVLNSQIMRLSFLLGKIKDENTFGGQMILEAS